MTDTQFQPSRRGLILGAGALAAFAPAVARAQTRFPALQAMLDGWVADGRLSGAAVGIRHADGPNTFLQAGQIDYGHVRAVDADTRFRIYSMTKPVTGVAAALLIEDGRLTLDTPVADFVPELANPRVALDPTTGLDSRPATRTMTVRHLLTHSSGLGYFFFGGPVADAYRRAGVFPVTGYRLSESPIDAPSVRTLDDMARALSDIPLFFEPGTDYLYSIGLDVLGLVIQRAAGQSFPSYVQQRLLDPIGMRNTVWQIRPGDQRELMQLYDYANGHRLVRDERQASAWEGPVTLYPGGAGLISTARDFLAFLTTVLDDGRAGSVRVMAPETARLIRSDILPQGVRVEDNDIRFGFGGSVDTNTGEWGWDGAAGTRGYINPTTRTAITVMVQHFGQAIDVKGDTARALASDVET